MTSVGPAGCPRSSAPGEDGASPITSVFGVLVFLTFLLFSVQVVLYLFTASVVQSAAVDGASHGAGAAQTATRAAARAHASQVLGRLADDASLRTAVRTDVSGDVLELTVSVRLPSLLGDLGLSTITRTGEARIER